jgi:hypothetical protein
MRKHIARNYLNSTSLTNHYSQLIKTSYFCFKCLLQTMDHVDIVSFTIPNRCNIATFHPDYIVQFSLLLPMELIYNQLHACPLYGPPIINMTPKMPSLLFSMSHPWTWNWDSKMSEIINSKPPELINQCSQSIPGVKLCCAFCKAQIGTIFTVLHAKTSWAMHHWRCSRAC